MIVKTSSVIKSGNGNGAYAHVTELGQLVTAPSIKFSEPFTATVNAINTAFVLAEPRLNKRFVITDILLDANKNVSASTAGTVEIYEAANDTSTTVFKSILSIEMLKNTNRIITGLNLIASEGYWVNIKTTDDIIYATVLGYYVDDI